MAMLESATDGSSAVTGPLSGQNSSLVKQSFAAAYAHANATNSSIGASHARENQTGSFENTADLSKHGARSSSHPRESQHQ